MKLYSYYEIYCACGFRAPVSSLVQNEEDKTLRCPKCDRIQEIQDPRIKK